MDWSDYRERIDTAAGNRFDTSHLVGDPGVFDAVVADLAAPFDGETIDLVVGIDALGFVFGTALAREFEVGFVPVRKGGKLPILETDRVQETVVDYTGTEKTLELDRTAIPDGARVLLADDWIETASQMRAAVSLVERAGGEVTGITVVGADENGSAAELVAEYRLHALNGERD